jgi:hypothetical protein
MARTVHGLSDGSLVNFIFSMTGLGSFDEEYRLSCELPWNGLKIRVLPLQRIYQSKKAAAREKDIAHLPLIKRVMRGRQLAGVSDGAGSLPKSLAK